MTEEIAEDAIRLIKVDYEVLPHLATVEQAMRPEAPVVFPKGNVSEVSERAEGNVEEGLAKASHIVEGLYSTQVQTHTSLETHGGVCEWEGEKLTAWVSTQAVHGARDGIAEGARSSSGRRARDRGRTWAAASAASSASIDRSSLPRDSRRPRARRSR